MSCFLCCRRARHDMGAALSNPQAGEACEGESAAPHTMADVIRERKKKAGSGGAALGSLRRRIRRARGGNNRPDRGSEHARFIRSVVSSWRPAEVFLLCEELEAGAAMRDLVTQAELARAPANQAHRDLHTAYVNKWWCDVEVVGGGGGWSLGAHRAVLAARSAVLRSLLLQRLWRTEHRGSRGRVRLRLEGSAAELSRAEMDAFLHALYSGEWDHSAEPEHDLDILNVDNVNSCGCASRCSCGAEGLRTARRCAAILGADLSALHADMRYLLDSGEYADVRLVFPGVEAAAGGGSAIEPMELRAHRVVLLARSRLLRSVLSRRSGEARGEGGEMTSVCVDERVLPRRYARAILHAAYTDRVDLSLIERNVSPQCAVAPPHGATSTGWSGVARGGGGGSGGGRGNGTAATTILDEVFQLYEIGRFLEMPIVVQGCEDAIAEALTPGTLPHVLRWSAQAHASQWVHRQAMRYLRDEFPAIMSTASSARLPRSALCEALASPYLQASEIQALRAVVRWAEHNDTSDAADQPNVIWHTSHSVSRRGIRKREMSDAALRAAITSLVAHVRLEHIPGDCDLLQQLVRRGVLSAPCVARSADAWLGRGSCRPARCFLPYLDELKALLEDQPVPEAEIARLRRARYLNNIPDTLYMVAARREAAEESVMGAGPGQGRGCVEARACLSPRELHALRRRTAALRERHARAAGTGGDARRPIALRAVREMSLPDSCAELLLTEPDLHEHITKEGMGAGESEHEEAPSYLEGRAAGAVWGGGGARGISSHRDIDQADARGVASVRCPSVGSVRSTSAALSSDTCRSNNYRRERDNAQSRSADSSQHRSWSSVSTCRGRLSAAVPDVAMAPNANTHLLTATEYYRHASARLCQYSGGVVQLDLGDGATHTPRPGSRAQRASVAALIARPRDLLHQHQSAATRQAPHRDDEEEELRAVIELSVIRAGFGPFGLGAGPSMGAVPGMGEGVAQPLRAHATLPHRYHSTSSTAGGVGAAYGPSGALSTMRERGRMRTARCPAPGPGPAPTEYALYAHDYTRLEANYQPPGSASTSREPSPNNYA